MTLGLAARLRPGNLFSSRQIRFRKIMNQATLRNNPDKQRYELVDAGQVVAFAEYRQEGDALALVHTEVSPEHGGKGYGSTLAKQALGDIRAQHKKVIPLCEFIAGYIGKHPEYSDLVKTAD